MTQTDIGVIGGSAAYRLMNENKISGERLGPHATPYGDSQPVYHVASPQCEFYFLSRHGERGYEITAPYVNYRANVYALRDLGVRSLIAWSGPGAINADFQIGQFIVPDDIVDETKNRPSTFYANSGIGFVRQHPTFCPELRRAIIDALEQLDLQHDTAATYVCTQGPRLETRAEIRKFAQYGGDLVGMTLAPEAFLAKELEMCYAALCYVTNYAEGVGPQREFRPGKLFEGLATPEEMARVDAAVEKFPEIITRLAEALTHRTTPPSCACRQTMLRYRERGNIGDDWHKWVQP